MQKAIIAGIKLASHESPFYNPTVPVLQLVQELKKLGIAVLTWAPETVCAEIDRRYAGWTDDQVAKALEGFHDTGIIQTEIPLIVRQKIYAIRVVATSDSAHTEWNIFEKVGRAFNDRPAQFSMIEPMSAAECAVTVALMDAIRPDSYTNEIKIYSAACAHEDGLYTVEPIPQLQMAEPALLQMNRESGDMDPELKRKIVDRFNTIRQYASTLREISEDVVSVQSAKLLAIDSIVAEALSLK